MQERRNTRRISKTTRPKKTSKETNAATPGRTQDHIRKTKQKQSLSELITVAKRPTEMIAQTYSTTNAENHNDTFRVRCSTLRSNACEPRLCKHKRTTNKNRWKTFVAILTVDTTNSLTSQIGASENAGELWTVTHTHNHGKRIRKHRDSKENNHSQKARRAKPDQQNNKYKKF